MKLFGITKIGLIPRHMWRSQLVALVWKIVDILAAFVLPLLFCIWLRHVIHPYIVQAVNYIEAVVVRTMN